MKLHLIMLTYPRLGRRKLMMFAVIGQGCCMAILAGTVWDGSHASGLVATVMLFLFNFFFGTGLLAIPWLCKCFHTAMLLDINTNRVQMKCSACRVFATRNSNSISRHGDSNKLYVAVSLPNEKG